MSLPRLWGFLAVALPTLGALIAGLSSVDLSYHLRAGSEILDSGAIPAVDSWTFTAAGLPWTDQQWGAQVILATVYRIGGWTGLVVLRAGLVAVTFACVFEIVRRRGPGTRLAALLTLAAFVVSAPALALRPQLMGMALFAIVLLLVADRRAHPRGPWVVPLVVLVWANIHGSFVLGPLVLGLAWLEDLHDRQPTARTSLLVAIASSVAACLTPFGPAVWAYAVGLSTNSTVTSRITEWQPTSLRDTAGLVFFLSAASVVALIARRGRRVPWPALAWLGVFTFIGVYAVRGIAWWSLAVVPIVASLLPAAEAGALREAPTTPLLRRLNVGLAGAIVVVSLGLLPAWRPVDPVLGAPAGLIADAPSGVTASLRDAARPGDRLFNAQAWGSWFEFAVPNLPVAIDSRTEFIPEQVWVDDATVTSGADGWEKVLDRWGVTLIAIGPRNDAMEARLTSAGWSRLFGDPSGSVFRAP